MKNIVKNSLLIILALVFVVQFLQLLTGKVIVKPLHGVTIQQSIPELTWDTWNSGEFQWSINKYLEDNFAFRSFFIRLNNQLYFSLFSRSTNPAIVVGKKNVLYEEPYIKSYFGEDFPGRSSIDEVIKELDTVNRYLQRWNTELIVVIAPNKAAYFPEYIPNYMVHKSDVNTYEYYLEKLTEGAYTVLDANAWFQKEKSGATYPWMTKTGIHWSKYSSSLVADSLIQLIEKTTGKNIPHFEIKQLTYPSPPDEEEKDLEKLMNIFTELEHFQHANNIQYNVIKDPTDDALSLLVIGDSFFWSFYQGYFVDCFKETIFWYYFSIGFPEQAHKVKSLKETDVVGTIAHKDAMVILTSPPNMHPLGFGFVHHLYKFLMLSRESKVEQLIPIYQKSINASPELLEMVNGKALERKIPLDSMIYLDAEWLAIHKVNELFPK